MNEFKGTKGEWKRNGYPRETVKSESGEICRINPHMGESEHVENCKLIASAPSMLNSLQETRESISLMKVCLSKLTDDTRELEDILENWKTRNQEVINKALGQTK